MSSYIINGTCISGTCKTVEATSQFFQKWSDFIFVLLIVFIILMIYPIYSAVNKSRKGEEK